MFLDYQMNFIKVTEQMLLVFGNEAAVGRGHVMLALATSTVTLSKTWDYVLWLL